MSDVSPWLYISTAVLWICVILLAMTVLGLVKLNADVQGQVQELTIHGVSPSLPNLGATKELPEFSATSISGQIIKSDDLVKGTSVLAFVSPGCPSCEAVLYDLEPLALRYGSEAVVVFCKGEPGQCAGLMQLHKLPMTIEDNRNELRSRFGVSSSPTILVSDRGTLSFHGYEAKIDELDRTLQSAAKGDGEVQPMVISPANA
jgi:thiol-disulfide isomerase/thioredoxin